MPEIDEPTDQEKVGPPLSLRFKPWILGAYVIALGFSIFGAIGDNDGFEWGQVGFITAVGMAMLVTPPTFAVVEQHRRVVQLLAGVVALVAAVVVFTRDRHGASPVIIGCITASIGVFLLIPAVSPGIGRRHPKQFGNHW